MVALRVALVVVMVGDELVVGDMNVGIGVAPVRVAAPVVVIWAEHVAERSTHSQPVDEF